MYYKHWMKYLLAGILLLICSVVCFAPVNVVFLNNETFFSTILGFKVQDWSVFIAFVIGIGSILVALFNNEKSYNAMKLASLPEKSANLLIDLEFIFNQSRGEDKLFLLIEILKYWRDNQKAFRLLTPNFYKNFLEIISYPDKLQNNESIFKINSQFVMCAIKSQISDIAFENEENVFSFIKPELIGDDVNIRDYGEDLKNYVEFKIEKNLFEKYIKDFKGKDTRNLAFNEFNKFYCNVEVLLEDLKREIEEYD